MTEIITTVHTYNQPIETSIKVGIEVDSKGQRKPSIEVRITRKLEAAPIAAVLEGDIRAALAHCKSALVEAMEA
ncbi:MAG: hypothetical protein Q8M94_22535 [Ignavibacteria bacterium]|nr:hypothetical protein [Ignavibacteria bacterium]